MARQTTLFTPEELAEMAAFDAEVDAGDITPEEIRASCERDKAIRYETLDNHKRKIAEHQREYRAANREKLAEYQREYRAANREKLAEYKREYYAANREKLAAAQREYYAANRESTELPTARRSRSISGSTELPKDERRRCWHRRATHEPEGR